MAILAIDPGGTTGIAVRRDDGDFLTFTFATPDALYTFLNGRQWEHVICENFVTGGHVDSNMLYTIRLVGGVDAICKIRSMPLTIHMPGYRYPLLPQAKFLLSGTPHLIHEEDALAHLLRYERDATGNQQPGTLRGRIAESLGL